MEIKLINGKFNGVDASVLISEIIRVKIAFLENKINAKSSEEEIKMRESHIKELQTNLSEFKKSITKSDLKAINLSCNLTIS
jgi:hypothetical protein